MGITTRRSGAAPAEWNKKIFSDEKIGLDKVVKNCNNISMIKVVQGLGGILPPNNHVTPGSTCTRARLFFGAGGRGNGEK